MRDATYEELCFAVKAIREGKFNEVQAILHGTQEASWTAERIKDRLDAASADILLRAELYHNSTGDWIVSALAGSDAPDLSAGKVTGECPVPPAPPLVPKPSVSKLVVSPGTPLACTGCHRVGMPFYYLKRSNGKYDVLCFDNGNGCWEHSSRNLCTYVDGEAQCTDLAEFLVLYGEETDLVRRAVCSRHVPAVLSAARSYRIYPIDDDYLAGGLASATVEASRLGA